MPVLGNGDIWSAEDALRMVAETGCDGVVVGRGCLGRPWLFTDLAAAFAGTPTRVTPSLGEVADTLRTHAAYLCDFYGEQERACRDIRKHIAWYLKGFPAGSTIRNSLALVDSLAALDSAARDARPRRPVAGGGRGGTARARRLVAHRRPARPLARVARALGGARAHHRRGRALRQRRLSATSATR